MHEILEWFWTVLESARPDLGRLASWLEAATRTEIEAFTRKFSEAKEAVANYSDGVQVDGTVFSEDSMEDLCEWIVAQGRDFWEAAVSGGTDLAELAREYLAEESGRAASRAWDASALGEKYRGYRSAYYLAFGVYRARFDADLYDAICGD